MSAFIDANVIVYATIPDAKSEESEIAILGGGFTNTLALAEAHRAIEKITRDRTTADNAVRQTQKHLEIRPVTEDDVAEALRHSTLDLFDAIHVATANDAEFVTWDRKLKDYAKTRRK